MAGHTLVLLRHAKSDWSTGEGDRHRPLAHRGRRQAPETGRWLADHGPALDHAVVSSATRARTTWDLVSAELSRPPPAEVDDRIYAASVADLLAVVADLPESAGTAVLVGHNPGFEDLVEELTGEPVPLPTSALAIIGVPGTWSDVRAGWCTLRASGRPPS